MSLSALIYNRNSQETADAPKSEYTQILENVQQYMSQEHGTALSEALTEDDAQATVLGLIQKYITDQKLMVSGMSVEELARRLHTDMCGFSVLDRYLHDPEVEEINVNRYDDIEILYHDRWEKSPSKFASPQQAQDIARRLVHCSGKVLDARVAYEEIPDVIESGFGVSIAVKTELSTNYDHAEKLVGVQRVWCWSPESGYGELSGYSDVFDSLQPKEGDRGDKVVRWQYKVNPYSETDSRLHYTTLWFPNGTYRVQVQGFQAWSPVGEMYATESDAVTINGDMYDRVTAVN